MQHYAWACFPSFFSILSSLAVSLTNKLKKHAGTTLIFATHQNGVLSAWWNLLMLLISCDTLPASFTSFNTLLLHPPPPTLCPLYNLMQWMIHRSWQNNACCSFLNRFALCPLPRHSVYYVPGFVLRLLTFVLIMLLCILNPWNVLPMNYEMTDTW